MIIQSHYIMGPSGEYTSPLLHLRDKQLDITDKFNQKIVNETKWNLL